MNNAKSNNVLITGATGGLGLALVKSFSQNGYNVLGTGRRLSAREKIISFGAAFAQADLTRPSELKKLCEGQSTIIHAAALSDSWGRHEDFYKINVHATQDLMAIAENTGVQNFIFISSPSIYAAMKDQYGLTEDNTASSPPLNEYAKTKLEAEKLVLGANNKIFKTVAVRPRAIVGPDDRVLLPKITKMIDRGILPLFRGGKPVIELTDVRDVAQAVLLAVQNIDNISGQAVNISGGSPIPIKELACKLAQSTNRKIYFIPLPMVLANYLARKLEENGIRRGCHIEPRLTRYTLATLGYSQTFDMSKAKKTLGYKPTYDAVQTILDVAKKRVI